MHLSDLRRRCHPKSDRLLENLEIVVNLIGATRTKEGLEVKAWLDGRKYEKGRKVTDEELEQINIKRNPFHGEWNYEIRPWG